MKENSSLKSRVDAFEILVMSRQSPGQKVQQQQQRAMMNGRQGPISRSFGGLEGMMWVERDLQLGLHLCAKQPYLILIGVSFFFYDDHDLSTLTAQHTCIQSQAWHLRRMAAAISRTLQQFHVGFFIEFYFLRRLRIRQDWDGMNADTLGTMMKPVGRPRSAKSRVYSRLKCHFGGKSWGGGMNGIAWFL
jgi:hypothetical protein